MFTRNTLINKFKELLLTSDKQYVVLCGKFGIGKSRLIQTLREDGTFREETTVYYESDENLIEMISGLSEDVSLVVVDPLHGTGESIIRTFIESYPGDKRIIWSSEDTIQDEKIASFILSPVSFREYTEELGSPLNMGDIMSGTSDIETLNQRKEEYMKFGELPRHISEPDTILSDYHDKRSIIESELFEKEIPQFREFIQTLAMETGNCFKADKLAKLLGITRRKVNKYMELLLKADIIRPIGPWVQDTVVETSRHVKIYFSDLSFYSSILGEVYAQGVMKQGAIENFIYLELVRKLSSTHTISYYRKKSGSEINFILEDKKTGKVTPIEVITRDTLAITQSLKSFDEDYHDRVERYMIMNESLAAKKDLSVIPVFILPHVAI